ncbi:MAG: hypothetical protein MUE50_04435 [Pirellulaceae bacterium]|nr:hypothetical protein [Pirellulaceae bacterium]
MLSSLFTCFVLTLPAAADDSAATLFEQAETLAKGNRKQEALAKVEAAVAELERAQAAGEKIQRTGLDGLRFAARLAREDFLDYAQSLLYCDKLFRLADSDYWRVPARLERALTYRAMGDFEKARAEYAAIAAADPRQRAAGILPQAEMVYFDLRDEQRGRQRIAEALGNEAINGRERFATLRKCAQQAIVQGRREEALRWYAMFEKLPFDKPDERARFLTQAWYEMGQIEETRGRTSEARVHYRKAMQLEDGEMRFRARARDALENIEYFE